MAGRRDANSSAHHLRDDSALAHRRGEGTLGAVYIRSAASGEDVNATERRSAATHAGTAPFGDKHSNVSCLRGRQVKGPSQIIARNTQARGGAAGIEQAKAVLIRMRIVEPKYTMDGVYRATRGGQMRIDVYMGGTRVYSEGCDGRRAWDLPADATHAEESSAVAAAALWHGLEYPTNPWGRKVAFKEEQYDLRSGALLQTSSITQVETNPVLKPDEFAPP